MNFDTVVSFGQIAGIGGLGLGVFLLIFREVVRKNIFARLDRENSYRAIRLVLILTWSLALAGLAVWGYSFGIGGSVAELSFRKPLSFNTGWIFAGYFDAEKEIYIDGPFASVAYRPGAGKRGAIVPKVGDVLLVNKERQAIIANFKVTKLRNQMQSPPLVHDPLTDDDVTGETLPKGALVIVRDVEVSGYPGRPASIWCRIAVCDKDNDGCMKAYVELGA